MGREEEGIRAGLRGSPRDISDWPKYLYDERGSEIFERITEQPEYYQTRTELSILVEHCGSIMSGEGFGEIVELGSGSSKKTRTLIDAMVSSSTDHRVGYTPLDVSESAVEQSTREIKDEYPGLSVSGYVGDFNQGIGEFLSGLPRLNGNRLVVFLGGTIGNFSPGKRKDFLRGVCSGLGSGDRFLVGVDLIKNVRTLEAAYNDRAGVTSEFNKNVLEVLNSRLGSDFDPGRFYHEAVYNESESRIEMWLISSGEHEVSLGRDAPSIRFETGEGIRTEISNKFTRNSLEQVFEDSGMGLVEVYTDREGLFGLALSGPPGF